MTGKVAVITGASEGIGAGLVGGYRAQGWAVVASARTIKPAEDPGVFAVEGDIAAPASAGRVARVALGEAPLPGITPPNPLILPDPLVDRLWHIPFNQLKETNEKLVAGREDIFFGAEFSASAGTNKLPAYAVQYYVDGLASSPEALHGSFQLYRAFGATTAQNQERKTRRLPMPVLAMGGAQSAGAMAADTMKLVADDVQTVVLAGSGHWVAEQAPQELLAALTAFLAPYRDGMAAE